jgi:hypothetical protein
LVCGGKFGSSCSSRDNIALDIGNKKSACFQREWQQQQQQQQQLYTTIRKHINHGEPTMSNKLFYERIVWRFLSDNVCLTVYLSLNVYNSSVSQFLILSIKLNYYLASLLLLLLLLLLNN